MNNNIYTSLPPDAVKVGGSIGNRIRLCVGNNLLKLDIENDFLHFFRVRNSKNGYYAGLGKLIDATVNFAAYTQDEQVLDLKDYLIAELLKSQDRDGYIGTKSKKEQVWGIFDCHDQVHIVSALCHDYRLFGKQESLAAAEKLMDCIIKTYPDKPKDTGLYGLITDHMMTLGMEHALISLYEITGKNSYLEFCLNECGLKDWNWDIELERNPPLRGHCYMFLNLVLAQLRLYILRRDPALMKQVRKVLDFSLNHGGMTVIGGIGMYECWTDDQCGRGDHAETCASVYLIKVLDALLKIIGNSLYGDLMERIIYNVLFAAQSPDGRSIRYYSPFEGKRVYFPKDTYCCPNNFRRIMAELPQMVYYRHRDGIMINLYTDSECVFFIHDKNIKLRQQTRYPDAGEVFINVDSMVPARFLLYLRIPHWAKTAVVRINGQEMPAPQRGNFYLLDRLWQNGDQLTLEFDMPLRWVKGTKQQYGMGALMKGPQVYTLNPQECCSVTRDDITTIQAGEFEREPNNVLVNLDGADLNKIRIKANSAIKSDNGRIQFLADQDGSQIGVKGSLLITLSPFPEPNGKCSYFHLNPSSVLENDELMQFPFADFFNLPDDDNNSVKSSWQKSGDA